MYISQFTINPFNAIHTHYTYPKFNLNVCPKPAKLDETEDGGIVFDLCILLYI